MNDFDLKFTVRIFLKFFRNFRSCAAGGRVQDRSCQFFHESIFFGLFIQNVKRPSCLCVLCVLCVLCPSCLCVLCGGNGLGIRWGFGFFFQFFLRDEQKIDLHFLFRKFYTRSGLVNTLEPHVLVGFGSIGKMLDQTDGVF